MQLGPARLSNFRRTRVAISELRAENGGCAVRYWVDRQSGRLVVNERKSLSARDAWALVKAARSSGLSCDVVSDRREPVSDEDLEKAANAREN